MIRRIAEACDFNGTTLSISASIGIAMYPADGDTADVLFKNADTAMYKAKGTEKRVVLFRESKNGLTMCTLDSGDSGAIFKHFSTLRIFSAPKQNLSPPQRQ